MYSVGGANTTHILLESKGLLSFRAALVEICAINLFSQCKLFTGRCNYWLVNLYHPNCAFIKGLHQGTGSLCGLGTNVGVVAPSV